MGNLKLERSRLVKAPARDIWNEILDVKSWPEWKPFIKKVTGDGGEIRIGSRFTMKIAVKGPAVPVPVEVITLDPYKEMAWTGGIPKTVVSVHSFLFDEKDGATLVTSREEFTGALVSIMPMFVTIKDLHKLHDDWLEAIDQRMISKKDNKGN